MRPKVITLEPGMRVGGRYVLTERIGQGSMAEVWRGRDEETRRPVAVKVVAELLAPSDKARRRFATEGRAVGRIHHPNVIELLDLGALDDDRPYMVMAYHPGETLHRYLERQSRMSATRVVQLGLQMLDGIGAAHDQGVVHRDIKPANILLAELTNGGRQVKILDFGVAYIIDLTMNAERLTSFGAMLGSPGYMPLEVAQGVIDIDSRSDIFSLGAVLYHALVGQPPFVGSDVRQIMRSIAAHDIAPIRCFRSDLPDALIDTIDRALARSPSDRFTDARQMRAALEVVPLD